MERGEQPFGALGRVKVSLLTASELRRLKLFRSPRSPMLKTVKALESGRISDLSDAEYYLNILARPYRQPIRNRLLAIEALRVIELTPKQVRRAELLLQIIVANVQTPETVRLVLRTINVVLRFACALIVMGVLETALSSIGFVFGLSLTLIITIVSAFGAVALPIWSFMYDNERELRLRQLAAATLERVSVDSVSSVTSAEPDLWDCAAYYVADVMEDVYLTDIELRRLMRWMTPGSQIWSAAQALVTKSFSDLDSPELYIKVLTRPHWRRSSESLIAVDALRLANLTPEQAERAEAVLSSIASYKRAPGVVRLFLRTLNMLRRLAGATLVAAFIFTASSWANNAVGGIPIIRVLFQLLFLFGVWGLISALVAVPIWSFKHDAKRELRLRQLSVAALEWSGPSCIETLASAANSEELMQVARPALRNVLSRLEPADYGKVSPLGLERLTALFSSQFGNAEADIWFHLLLDSLGVVGTGACVASVEAVAESGRKPEWQEHARRILPILIERKRMELDSSRLLRPTVGSENVDSLLRPAASSGGDSEDNLLRSTQDTGVMH